MSTKSKQYLSLSCGITGLFFFLNFYSIMYYCTLKMIYEKSINCFNDFLSVKYWHYFDIKVVKHFPWEHTVPWEWELPTSCDEPAMSYVPTAPAMDQSWPVPDSKPCVDHARSFWLAFGALRLFVTTFINTAWWSRKAKTISKSW